MQKSPFFYLQFQISNYKFQFNFEFFNFKCFEIQTFSHLKLIQNSKFKI